MTDYSYLFNTKHNTDWIRTEIKNILKKKTDIPFVEFVLKEHIVERFWDSAQYFGGLYVLSVLEYLFDKYNQQFPDWLKQYQNQKFDEPIFSVDINMIEMINPNDNIKEKAMNECKIHPVGKYFYTHNIIEKDIFA